ncbi:hypothetical protein ES332_D01G104500v1 [Gossypium tomentosum]|uniref:Uncharacterized protein n=1 Tax=Gossypium tomentosum TaxID=34277 RepID=A0A5D2M7Z1_GOSTO|nr:hypothetical protein ES332_D01G104500v1 [Gossypium tomentosum]
MWDLSPPFQPDFNDEKGDSGAGARGDSGLWSLLVEGFAILVQKWVNTSSSGVVVTKEAHGQQREQRLRFSVPTETS